MHSKMQITQKLGCSKRSFKDGKRFAMLRLGLCSKYSKRTYANQTN